MTGVYRITNTVTDRVYIGSAVNVEKRLTHHQQRLSVGKHENGHLQRSWDKHGRGVFVFEPLVECSIETRKEREQRFIDAYVEHDLPLYNMRPSLGSPEKFRFRHTEETKAKLRLAALGRTGVPWTEWMREKMRVVHTGRKRTEEAKARMRLAALGRTSTWKGKKHSEGSKANMKLAWVSRRERHAQKTASLVEV
jgi:group I intron endonuclease